MLKKNHYYLDKVKFKDHVKKINNHVTKEMSKKKKKWEQIIEN